MGLSLLLLLAAQPAYAATASKTTVKKTTAAKVKKPTSASENSIKISPLRTDITIAPGKTGIVKIDITNLSKSTAEYQAIENDFVAGDEKGTPAIILDKNSYAPTHSLKRFMVPIKNITVGAGQTGEVQLIIKVPITAQAGGYYGALRFAPASAGSGQLALSGSAASLVLMTVPGPAVQKMVLTNFDVQQNGYTATNFRTPNDLSVLVRFKNEGNLQEAPFGQITVTKGKTKLVATDNFNQDDPKDEVLPDSARRWNVPLKGLGKFGKYTVVGTFTYGNGQSIQVSKVIWIIPTLYLIAAGAALLIGLVVIWLVIHFIRKSRYRNHYRKR
jgi:hypothetical protein